MKVFSILSFLLIASSALATDDSVVNDPFKKLNKESTQKILPISPAENYKRTQAVLNYFNVPAEASNADLMSLYNRGQTLSGLTTILQILDPENQFFRFGRIESDALQVYLDRDSREEEDASFLFNLNGPSYQSEAIKNLLKAKGNPANLPLKGLKIAIDPGHMSTRDWDKYTGKFVKDRAGNYVSEGLIALQTALLLKQDFEALGAEVKLTRENHEAVTEVPLRSLDVKTYALEALREQSLQSWFLSLISQNPVGSRLYNSFTNSSKFKSLFRESARYNYFVLREDLEARVKIFEDFQPDISFAIHYDSQDPPRNPTGVNTKNYSRVKTYVHGSIAPDEWATNSDRRYFLHHALDTASWDASFSLAKNVVNSLSSTLGLGYDNGGGGNSRLVAPGVFSRNLYVTKKSFGHAHTYIECLHYNDPTEFRRMLRKDYSMQIDGQTTYYSSRVRQVADAIRDGVLAFVTERK